MKEKEFTFEEEQQMLYERMQAESSRELTETYEKIVEERWKKIEEYGEKYYKKKYTFKLEVVNEILRKAGD